MSRVALAKVPSLTFYKDAVTEARRSSAWPQLTCLGSACKLYQPEVVRCVNLGGSGTDIDWKCEADLPESLRFGKVEVNCEGWSRAGDSNVLKGSCALQYRLVQVPSSLRNGKTDSPIFGAKSYDISTIIFWLVWLGILAYIMYQFFKSWWSGNVAGQQPRPNNGPRPGPGGGSGNPYRGWFPYDHPDYGSPPPPYSKTPPQAGQPEQGWRPGFWTGAALGGVATHLWNRQNEPRYQREPVQQPAEWGWEQARNPFSARPARRTPFQPPNQFNDDDRGEGTSNLGAMRSSTGFGGSNVR
ncbi:DUF1183-domain-containing protein [Coprinellus micaceus]|uniref:Store-operated calcium entry-associated regulatory factor n=1 Tax=Coprinellus micaceus TaxID=71717 RepID=A0A4Y7TKU0_COPMI|nr:DUF1183-domain-containing protein [Coprinellus micaceus]